MHLEDFRGHIRWEEGSQTPLTLNFSFKEKNEMITGLRGGFIVWEKHISLAVREILYTQT